MGQDNGGLQAPCMSLAQGMRQAELWVGLGEWVTLVGYPQRKHGRARVTGLGWGWAGSRQGLEKQLCSVKPKETS